jgi:membrane associated rhomboid family serine protease/Zn-finger nucleic acid-binding protein
MYTCPNCGEQLTKRESALGVYWGCPACGGYAVSMAILRKAVEEDCVVRAWAAAREGGSSGRACPMCDHVMTEVPITVGESELKLDVCKICQFFWFDPNELELLPAAPQPPPTPESRLPLEAREALALAEVQRIAEAARAQNSTPDSLWKTIPGIFGFPVETDADPLRSIPWATWSLAAIIAVVSLSTFSDLNSVVAEYGLIPARVFRDGGMTVLTSFFLHGGIMHLVGNLYFLVIFGSKVEDSLGRLRFLALLLAAIVLGDALHVLAQPDSTVPCIGASGGISGLIAFYALQFPHARLGFWLRFRWVQMPAWVALILWILLQGFGAYMQLSGFSHVAALAHIGGALSGLAFWLAFRAGSGSLPPQTAESQTSDV